MIGDYKDLKKTLVHLLFFDTALHPVREAYNRPRYLSFPGVSEEFDRAYIKMFCCSSVAKSENAMANHSSTLAWKIPWKEEAGRLQSMELQRVGHNKVTSMVHWFTGSTR